MFVQRWRATLRARPACATGVYGSGMASTANGVTIYHNPNCNSSVNAVRIAEEVGAQADIVLYLKTPPDAATLRTIIGKLEDPVTDLVRRDNLWAKLGLTDDDAATDDQVVDLLVRHKQLLQRPLLVTADKAIIGRPKDRVRELLA
jgi:arsenate reductase